MRVFVTRGFARFSRTEAISDADLAQAIKRAERGLIDAELGGGLIKQRIARQGQGRSAGYRVIIAIKFDHVAVFLLGFAKNNQANISRQELEEFRTLGRSIVSAHEAGWEIALKSGTLREIAYG